ncbi:hypothetical protein [Streptomyces canarius]
MIKKWAVHLLFSALVLLGLSGGAAYSPQHAEGAARYDDILYFPASRYPETGAHISDAIKAGHSDVCTIERSGADKRRQESLKGIPTKPGFDRDEWPMAMCEELLPAGTGRSRARSSPTSSRAVLLSLVALHKGKARTALFGVIVPLVALVGAVRLARPGSPWARRFYGRRPRARARAALRAYRHDRRWARPSRAVQDWIGGKPDPRPARLPGHR